MKSNSSWLLDIGDVQHRLVVWRKTRRRGQRIPERLWAAVAVLAGAHGVSPASVGYAGGIGPPFATSVVTTSPDRSLPVVGGGSCGCW